MHSLTLKTLATLGRLYPKGSLRPILARPKELMGLLFANPVGLAAGFDKSADCIDGLATLGFGFIEVGTLTPNQQSGNAKPRLFRAPAHQALVNRLGFNNKGINAALSRLRRRRYPGVLGVSLGKNPKTPNDRAIDDYFYGLRTVYAYADYIALNLSSPNTPGLREAQSDDSFSTLLTALHEQRQRLADSHHKTVPLLVKVSPDMTNEEADIMANRLIEAGIDGVIATNTTVTRPPELAEEFPEEKGGGLSGTPLRERSLAIIKQFRRSSGEALTIIGVGGIMDSKTANETLHAGADLVQLYTGLVYQGPGLVRRITGALPA